MSKASLLYIFLSWLTVLPSVGYQNQIDSLQNLLDKTSNKEDSQRVNLLNSLAFEYRNYDNQKALEYGVTAQTLAKKISYVRGLMLAETHLGWIYYRGDDTQNAFFFATKALRQSKILADLDAQISNLNTIGCVYNDQEKYDLAIEYLREAVKIGKKSNLFYQFARSCNNLSYGYIKRNQLDSAFFYAQKALQIGTAKDYPYLANFAKRNIGDIYTQKKDYQNALKAYQNVLLYAKKENDSFLKISINNKIGEIFLQSKQEEQAIQYFKEAIDIGELYHLPFELHVAYKNIAAIYQKKQNINATLYYQSRYVKLLDSLYQANKKSNVIESQFETERKKAEIDSLEKEKAAQKLEIVKRNLFLALIFFLFILSSTFAILLFKNNRQKYLAYQIVLKQKNEIAEQNEEIKQAKEELNTQAEHLKDLNRLKDKILAIISHDLRNPIANLRSLLELLERDYLSMEELTIFAKSLKKSVDVLYTNMDTVLLWSYAQIGGLKTVPTYIDIHEIVAIKAQLFEMSMKNKNLEFQNQVPLSTFVFADQDQIKLILRNLIANAIKFTPKNGKITISTTIEADKIITFVKDTGVGISKENVANIFDLEANNTTKGTEGEKGTGLGLLLCKEFVENNGGAIWVESEVGVGTTFSFSLPIKEKKYSV